VFAVHSLGMTPVLVGEINFYLFICLIGVGELLEHGGRGRGEPEALGHLRGPSQGQALRIRQVKPSVLTIFILSLA
jgi:hypothetical protein